MEFHKIWTPKIYKDTPFTPQKLLLLLYDYIKPKNEILALENNSKIEYS